MAGTPHLEQHLQTRHLGRVDGYLPTCHIADLHVVERLHKGLCHLRADVVASLLQVLRSRLKVELTELHLIGNLETRKQRDAGADAE